MYNADKVTFTVTRIKPIETRIGVRQPDQKFGVAMKRFDSKGNLLSTQIVCLVPDYHANPEGVAQGIADALLHMGDRQIMPVMSVN